MEATVGMDLMALVMALAMALATELAAMAVHTPLHTHGMVLACMGVDTAEVMVDMEE